jgi:hypothetical protein
MTSLISRPINITKRLHRLPQTIIRDDKIRLGRATLRKNSLISQIQEHGWKSNKRTVIDYGAQHIYSLKEILMVVEKATESKGSVLPHTTFKKKVNTFLGKAGPGNQYWKEQGTSGLLAHRLYDQLFKIYKKEGRMDTASPRMRGPGRPRKTARKDSEYESEVAKISDGNGGVIEQKVQINKSKQTRNPCPEQDFSENRTIHLNTNGVAGECIIQNVGHLRPWTQQDKCCSKLVAWKGGLNMYKQDADGVWQKQPAFKRNTFCNNPLAEGSAMCKRHSK